MRPPSIPKNRHCTTERTNSRHDVYMGTLTGARLPESNQPIISDFASDFDNKTYHEGTTEYLGKLPDDQFHEAAKNAVAQAPEIDRQGLLAV
jgi:hypothetical protein